MDARASWRDVEKMASGSRAAEGHEEEISLQDSASNKIIQSASFGPQPLKKWLDLKLFSSNSSCRRGIVMIADGFQTGGRNGPTRSRAVFNLLWP